MGTVRWISGALHFTYYVILDQGAGSKIVKTTKIMHFVKIESNLEKLYKKRSWSGP